MMIRALYLYLYAHSDRKIEIIKEDERMNETTTNITNTYTHIQKHRAFIVAYNVATLYGNNVKNEKKNRNSMIAIQ